MSRDKGNAMPSSLTTNRVKKATLTVFINFQKETKLQTVNPLTLAQTLLHYTTPQTELSNMNQRACHGREENQIVQSQTLEGE